MPTKTKTTKKNPARRKVTASKKRPAPASAETAFEKFTEASDAASTAFQLHAEKANAVTAPDPLAPRAEVHVHVYPHAALFYQPDSVVPYSTLGYGPKGSDAHATAHDAIARLRSDGAEVKVKRFDASGKEIA